MLAVLSSIGVTTIAGCSGDDGGASTGDNSSDGTSTGEPSGDDSSGDTSTDESSGDGCIPETDSLADLFPEESEGFNLQQTVESGLEIGTDNYVVAIYSDPNGREVAAIAAQYENPSATEDGAEAIREESTDSVTGILVDGEIVVGFDTSSESTAQALLRASAIRDECASQLSFGGVDGVGDVIWGQRGGNSEKTYAVDARGVSTDESSSYTIDSGYTPAFTENVAIARNAIYNKSTGEAIRELPAEATDTPVAVDETVFFSTGTEVIAADVTTGDEIWQYTPVDNPLRITATGEVVLLLLPEEIVAISTADGSETWSTSIDMNPDRLAIAGSQVYVFGSDTAIYNLSDGSEVSTDIPPIRDGARLDTEGNLYLQEFSRETTKINSDGEEMWSVSEFGAPKAVDDTQLYTATEEVVYALSTDDGTEQWSFQTPFNSALTANGSVVVGTERAYITSNSSRVLAVDKTSGESQAVYAVDSGRYNVGAIGGGVISMVDIGTFGETIVLTEE